MKKHIDVIISAAWFVLLLTLMLRMPAIRVLQDPKAGFGTIDLCLSALFCAVGIFAPVFAYIFSKKQLFAVSFVNLLLFAAMLALFAVGTFSGNRGLLDFSMYFVNLFCFVLGLEGSMIAYCSVFLFLQIISTVLFSVFLKLKK